MFYQVECETLEGTRINAPVSTLAAAKQRARRLSCKHIVAYAVAYEHGEAVGHVVYGEGVKCGIEGRVC